MKFIKHINPNVKWIAGVFTILGLLVFSAGYTINNAFSDDDKIIVKILKIHDGDTTIIEREFTDMEELEALHLEMEGEDLHKLGMKMWHFSDAHDGYDADRADHSFKFLIEHGDPTGKHNIHKRIIITNDGDTVETAEFNFDMQKMHIALANAFRHIDDMDFNFDFDINDSMHFEYHDFDVEEFQKKLENMERQLERAMNNFQFNFEVEEDNEGKDCRIIIKSFPDGMEHIERMMEEIIIEIEVDENDGDHKVIKHIIKVYSDKDDNSEEFQIDPKNQLDIYGLSVYPNPGTGEFKIEFELKPKGQTEVEIRDMKGGIVFHDEFKNQKGGSYYKEVHLEGAAKGVYILTVKQGKKLANKKLIIR